MRLPDMMPTRPAAERNTAVQVTPDVGERVEPAGCCLKVCAPIVGCTCVQESPLCP